MSYVDWSDHPEYDRKLLALKEYGNGGRFEGGLLVKGRSFADIARLMNEWSGTDLFTKDNVQKRYNSITPPPSLADFPEANPTPYLSTYFDALVKPRLVAVKQEWELEVAKLFGSGRWIKTLVLSDTQGIVADNDLLDQAMREQPDADIVLIPGDVCDWWSASKYTKTRDFPMVHEADWYVRFLVALTERYPNAPIIIPGSNHRRRVEKSIRSLPQEMLFLAEHNPEKYLAQPFSNVHSVEPWWVQLGGAIYAHKEGDTSDAGNNARDAIETFLNWGVSQQYGVKPFDLVVTGHSHKLANIFHKSRQGIEPGCLAKLPMEYMTGASTKSTQENGYAIVVQKDGVVEHNESRFIRLANTKPSLRIL